MTRMPSIFVSHGSPMMALEDSPARRFLSGYGRELGRPAAILIASAHWETPTPTIAAAKRPEIIYDFYGFPQPLYEFVYDAPGAPETAERAAVLLRESGIEAALDGGRGLDHGAWVPLVLMYPEADIPVTQIAIQTHLGPAHQLAVGQALAPLRDDGVLIMGSGNMTHNLGELRRESPDGPGAGWVTEFSDWVYDAVTGGRIDDLLDYRALAPHAVRNHPRDEHFQPLMTAIGAGGPDATATRVHASNSYGALAMDAYAFD